MKTVDFDIDHIDDMIKYLDQLQKRISIRTKQFEGALKDLCEVVYEQRLLNVKVFTGELMQEAYVQSSTYINTVNIEVGNLSPHAYFVEYGTGKYVDRPNEWIVHESQFPKEAIEAYNFEPHGKGFYIVRGQRPKWFFAHTIGDLYFYVPDAIEEFFKDI